MVFESQCDYRKYVLQQSRRMTDFGYVQRKQNMSGTDTRATFAKNQVRWSKPTLGWCKLNTDGNCLALEAELWSIFKGLLSAWLIEWWKWIVWKFIVYCRIMILHTATLR
ncbi:hypothetical protein V6N11_015303 [Hibiscus sabdariffa]|uniref:RNase H type-1 domain-containing protein n=1 Tax=Hibiscus sabdariffa TaxID=183260 RepID=A0ABR2TRN5_9ROSI